MLLKIELNNRVQCKNAIKFLNLALTYATFYMPFKTSLFLCGGVWWPLVLLFTVHLAQKLAIKIFITIFAICRKCLQLNHTQRIAELAQATLFLYCSTLISLPLLSTAGRNIIWRCAGLHRAGGEHIRRWDDSKYVYTWLLEPPSPLWAKQANAGIFYVHVTALGRCTYRNVLRDSKYAQNTHEIWNCLCSLANYALHSFSL